MNKYLEDLFSLKNEIAVVTGGARGNGKAITEALLKAGATVVIVDQLKNELTRTLKSFKKLKFDCYEFNCDITNKHQILKLKNFIKKKFNRIDILVNNAGFTSNNELLTYPDKIWEIKKIPKKIAKKSDVDIAKETCIEIGYQSYL